MNRPRLLKHLRERFSIDWHGAHGGAHWARVRKNVLLLAKTTGANSTVVEFFSFFHDSCRNDHRSDRCKTASLC